MAGSDDNEPPPELELISEDEDEEEQEQLEEIAGGYREPAPFIIGKVASGLYLGNVQACHPAVLSSQFNITHVLGIGCGLPISLDSASNVPRKLTPTAAEKTCQYEYSKEGFEYMLLEVEDSQDTALLNYMHGCFKFINSALKDKDQSRTNNVLVFCEQGKSASVTVLGSYLMCERKLKLPVVMGLVKEVQPAAEPNKGFARHLRFLDRAGELPEWACP
eukprot:CAMPEP_0114310762 /NCGR_PEP_ID=MMETSP0059-20121206/19433_1 /TAXON_ID=36894 /ORGANISM="Pyramimonas parkeae, Strain CCMP726" /LENGTH=218 /DNA_ID=CAMNT_0001434829 /DNA_START=295 /DNA_END=952 /DNA_ORIENTATION=+